MTTHNVSVKFFINCPFGFRVTSTPFVLKILKKLDFLLIYFLPNSGQWTKKIPHTVKSCMIIASN